MCLFSLLVLRIKPRALHMLGKALYHRAPSPAPPSFPKSISSAFAAVTGSQHRPYLPVRLSDSTVVKNHVAWTLDSPL